MASNNGNSGSSSYPSAPNGGGGLFGGWINTVKAVFSTTAATLPQAPSLDSTYVEVFDEMNTAIIDTGMESVGEKSEQKPVTNLGKRVYDRDFLLELGKKSSKAPHPLKFSIDAIHQNILKHTNLSTMNDSRARGLSNVSKDSMVSECEEVLFKRSDATELKQPYRQPDGPPETPLAQIHAGFRRFLKEHSSPPHNRVTAGGRIVPVGPHGPHGPSPPSFNLSSIDNVIHGQSQAVAAFVPPVASVASSIPRHGECSSSSAMENYHKSIARQESQGGSQHSEASFVTAPFNTSVLQNQVVSFPTPLPPGAQVLAKLAHGPTLVMVNNVLFEAVSEGVNTILAPLTTIQPNAQLAQQLMHTALPTVAQVPITPMQPLPLMNLTTNVPVMFNQPSLEVQRQALQNHLEAYRAELDRLDKHVALHRSNLGSYALNALIAQRRYLVIQIDELRVSRDNLDKMHPFGPRPVNAQVMQAAPSFANGNRIENNRGQYLPGVGLPVLAGGPHMYGAVGLAHAGNPSYDIAMQIPPGFRTDTESWSTQMNTQNGEAQAWQHRPSYGAINSALPTHASGSSLNPDPGLQYVNGKWIPAGVIGQVHQQEYAEPAQVSEFTKAPMTANRNTAAEPASQPSVSGPGHTVSHNGFGNNQTRHGLAHQEVSKVPLVTEQQAEYANILGLNHPHEPKKFCTAPAEFAEVIRQAREQAKLYGRVDVHTADPLYDAELDVRWAMADHEPIPLPKRVPDYVSNPQPFEWHSIPVETAFQQFPLGYAEPKEFFGSSQNLGTGVADHRTGDHTYSQENTVPVTGPLNPTGHQTTWTENDDGKLIRRSNQAYVEDAPETPSNQGFSTGSLTGASIRSAAYPPVPNTWGLPTLDECKGNGIDSDKDSWASNSQDDPRYPPLPEHQRKRKMVFKSPNGTIILPVKGRFDTLTTKQLEASSGMNYASTPNNQKDFLRTMLKDHRQSAGNDFADFQARVEDDLRKAGRNADGTPIGSTAAYGSVNKENQRSVSYPDNNQFQNVLTRERERNAVIPKPDGAKDGRMHKASPSVAAPRYQARGHLPQYDGAADSLSSGAIADSERSSSDKGDHVGARTALAGWVRAVAPSFYEPVRRFHGPEVHHYKTVDNFFRAIREEEREEIARYKAEFPLS